MPELALAMACAAAIVAVAFAGSRSSTSWAKNLYWVGQVTIYAIPTAFLLFRRSILKVEAIGIALLMPVTTYLVLLYYSPTQFRFLDEFGHVQTAQSILATHHLFHVNTYLTPSPQFPGLEIVTTAIVNMTHLSITASGLIVAGVAHVLAGLCIYFIVAEVTGKPRLAALAAVIFATSPHYQFFDSYFIYETIAIPFLLLAVLAVVKMFKAEGRVANAWGVVAIACGAVTAVSHHVTSYMLIGLLFAFCVAQLFLPRPQRDWRVLAILVATAAMVAGWDLKVATNTVAYFKPEFETLLGHHTPIRSVLVGSVATGSHKHAVSGNPPLFDVAMEYVSVLLLMVLTVIGVRKVWVSRRTGRQAAALGLALASLGIFVVVAARGVAGALLAARSLTFALIPVSFVAALAIGDRLRNGSGSSKHARVRTSALRTPIIATVIVVAIAIGGITGGYPNFYSRLPGPFLMGAWERSVDSHNVDAASWAGVRMSPHNGVASDFFTGQIIDALGHQAARRNIADLFLSLEYTNSDRALVRHNHITYVVIDRRITKLLPTAGFYFSADPGRGLYSTPLPAVAIDKFETVPGISRVFDDGTIVIYALKGSTKS